MPATLNAPRIIEPSRRVKDEKPIPNGGAIRPPRHSDACLDGLHSQDGTRAPHGVEPLGGRRPGNPIDRPQAENLPVPDAMATLTLVSGGPPTIRC